MVTHRPGDMKGMRTHETIALNRCSLTERRRDQINKVVPFIDRWAMLPDGPDKDISELALRALTDVGGEFSAAVTSFVNATLGDG